ncbi:hypothetical protein L0Z72_00740 [candidate division KSB1 bacterium]|nr:hypothetical protein [candidate division KSB1 bacterium]
MKEMKTNVSPYIVSIRDRKIRNIISHYLDAYRIFIEYNQSFHNGVIMSFTDLRKLNDVLFKIKEDFHLIYKRILNPRKRIFEQANKLIPVESEITFMNNVGLLFHKVYVARELKYVLDYYEEDSNGYQETIASLDRNLDRIKLLFDQGLELLMHMLDNYQNNLQLITYFLENKETCTKILKKNTTEILKVLARGRSIEDVYMDAIHYYQNSGWMDKTETLLKELLWINPKNEKATVMLQAINI